MFSIISRSAPATVNNLLFVIICSSQIPESSCKIAGLPFFNSSILSSGNQLLGFHKKPIGILNVDHYYDHFINFIQHMNDGKFLHDKYRNMALISDNPKELLTKFKSYSVPGTKTYNL